MKEFEESDNTQDQEEFVSDVSHSENDYQDDFSSDCSSSNEEDFSPDFSASEINADSESDFATETVEMESTEVTEDAVESDEWSSDFSGLEKNNGLGDDNFETNVWDDTDDSDSEDDGYWEPPKDNSYDWGDDSFSSDDDWTGGEGDGGGWGTDGGEFGDSSSDYSE